MIEPHISFYDNHTPWGPAVGRNFQIRGFAYRETMPRGMVCNGDKAGYPWPWLLIFFHDPATVVLEDVRADVAENSLMVWPAGASHEELCHVSKAFWLSRSCGGGCDLPGN